MSWLFSQTRFIASQPIRHLIRSDAIVWQLKMVRCVLSLMTNPINVFRSGLLIPSLTNAWSTQSPVGLGMCRSLSLLSRRQADTREIDTAINTTSAQRSPICLFALRNGGVSFCGDDSIGFSTGRGDERSQVQSLKIASADSLLSQFLVDAVGAECQLSAHDVFGAVTVAGPARGFQRQNEPVKRVFSGGENVFLIQAGDGGK